MHATIPDAVLLIGAAMVFAPAIRAAAIHSSLFRTRGIVFERPSLHAAFLRARGELQKWASTLRPGEYFCVMVGSMIVIAGHILSIYEKTGN